jgi:hypothetical protein
MDKKDASLLDALCDRPLAADDSDPSPRLRAFCIEAAEALRGLGDGSPDPTADPDVAAALIATVHSGLETEAERAAFNSAATRSAAFRLDVQSALAFVDAIERPERAPAHLVASLAASAARPEPRPRAWRLLAVRPHWRVATAFTVALAAGGLASALYLRPGIVEHDGGPTISPTVVGRVSRPAPRRAFVAGERPSGARHEAAKVPSCPPAAPAGTAAPPPTADTVAEPVAARAEADCGPPAGPHPVAATPVATDPVLADRPDDTAAALALRRAEAARQSEAGTIRAARRLGAAGRQHGSATASGAPPAAAARPASPALHFGDQAPAAAATSRPAAVDRAK